MKPVTPVTAALAKSRLARAVQRGDSPERIEELRRLYYGCRAKDYLAGLISADRLSPHDRAELADLLLAGGGAR